jgi:CrcB protein
MPVSLLQVLLVALGGALPRQRAGAPAAAGAGVPGGTLAVNVAGSLVIGFIGGAAEGRQFLVPDLRVFLLTGVLGGFTTFSAFAFESLGLGLDGAWTRLALNVSAQLVLGLGAAWAGYALGRAL